MATSAKDRLNKLFEGKKMPTLPNPDIPHFAESELQTISKGPHDRTIQGNGHQPLHIPDVPQHPHKVAREPHQGGEGFNKLTSSDDDDDYISAFKKKPMMLPQRSKEHAKPGRPVIPEPDTFRYPKDAYTDPLAPLDHIPKSKSAVIHLPNNPSDTKNPSENGDLPTGDADGNLVTGHFCIFQLVAKFPYKYMVDADDRVSRHFFANNKFYNRIWDM
jgi:hypothetical protein